MAKGNMLLGYSRGSVGDVTFYRSGGSQRSRARNRNPNNPRTEKQQTQRSRFANAVKFYKQVTTNFFRFAYEDKKVNESDYNAFMRHNTLRSGFIGAQASKVSGFPALGAWEVTSGSLPTINGSSTSQDLFVFDVAADSSSAFTTIGALSTYLVTNYPSIYREGDIITVLVYVANSSVSGATLPTVDVESGFQASAGYMQFTLDSSSTVLLNTIKVDVMGFNYYLSHSSGEGGGLHVNEGGDESPYFVQVAVIHSRDTAEGLLVSTQEMIAAPAGDAIVNSALATSGTYYNSVIADWDAAANAVLQGSASVN